MVLNVDEGLEWEVYVDGIRFEDALGFKYLDELGTVGAECNWKVVGGRRVSGS